MSEHPVSLHRAAAERTAADTPQSRDPVGAPEAAHPAATSSAWGGASLAPLPQAGGASSPLPLAGGVGGGHSDAAVVHHNHFSGEKQAQFLEALALWGGVRGACRAASIAAQTAYRHRRASADFARAWDAALLVARPRVEDVLADRAIHGVEEPVYYHGEEIARRRRYDSRLLLAHLGRLDRIEAREELEALVYGFDDAMARIRRGEPLDPPEDDAWDPYAAEDDDERPPYAQDDDGEEDEEDEDDELPDPYGDEDEEEDPLDWTPRVSSADIALLRTRRDLAALDAIRQPRSADAWIADGHAARLAAYRAEEAEKLSQDTVTPVTLPEAEAGDAAGTHPAATSSRSAEASLAPLPQAGGASTPLPQAGNRRCSEGTADGGGPSSPLPQAGGVGGGRSDSQQAKGAGGGPSASGSGADEAIPRVGMAQGPRVVVWGDAPWRLGPHNDGRFQRIK